MVGLHARPKREARNGLKIRVYRVRLTAWAHRFITKVDDTAGPAGCWSWTARRDPRGYGRFKLDGRPELAHRIAYQLAVGEIPDGLVVRHKCDNPPCVNPAHLELGTHDDNMQDKVDRGRAPCGERVPSAKLTAAQVEQIRASGARGIDLAARYGVSPSLITQIRKGQLWRRAAARALTAGGIPGNDVAWALGVAS